MWCWMVLLVLSLGDFSFTHKVGTCKRPGQKEHLSSYQQVDVRWKGRILVIVPTVNNKCSYVKLTGYD